MRGLTSRRPLSFLFFTVDPAAAYLMNCYAFKICSYIAQKHVYVVQNNNPYHNGRTGVVFQYNREWIYTLAKYIV